MVTISAQLPIDVAISAAHLTLQDDATADLRNVIKEIDENSKKKEHLRKIQEQLVLAKAAARTGDSAKTNAELNKLGQALGDPDGTGPQTGYGTNTALGQSYAETTGLKSGNNWLASDDPSSDISKKYDAYFEALETQLKSEMDRHSDISSKLQVEMNTKASILRRAEQAVSDNESAFQKTKEGIQRNYKG